MMGRRKAVKTESRQKPATGRDAAAIGTVVPLKRAGRRAPHGLPLGESQPSLHNLISEGQQQQADFLKLRWQRDLSLGVAAAMLVCFLAALWWLLERPGRPATAHSTPPSLLEPVPVPPPTVTAPGATAESQITENIRQAVEAWASAWSAQDVDAYLDSYAASFQIPGQASRQAWEAQRRQRLLAPELIAVVLQDLEIEITGTDTALARFVQTYASPGYSDRVSKTLAMRYEAGSWRILEERS